MTVEKLERVMWRLRKSCPGEHNPKYLDLRDAIMKEIGTDIRTYINNRQALRRLGWIKSISSKSRFHLTNKDLE